MSLTWSVKQKGQVYPFVSLRHEFASVPYMELSMRSTLAGTVGLFLVLPTKFSPGLELPPTMLQPEEVGQGGSLTGGL